MKRNTIPRILLGLVAALILSSLSSAEILKIVVNDTIQPITEESVSYTHLDVYKRQVVRESEEWE